MCGFSLLSDSFKSWDLTDKICVGFSIVLLMRVGTSYYELFSSLPDSPGRSVVCISHVESGDNETLGEPHCR